MITLQTLQPGAFLRHNTYKIEQVLGQGGFGITYMAIDLNLERKVAIKEFFPKNYCSRDSATSQVALGTQSSKEFVDKLKAKFLKEARNIAKFDHPGIIKIHAAFEENDTAYYVMDYIEGCSLLEMVKRNGPLKEEHAIEIIDKIGSALEYVHARKINHLDVKPANIMIRYSDNKPVLIDFGLSKQYDSEGNQTSTTPTGISHGYAPMEQYNDGGVKEFSPQTDLYSLAATLYYLLSGIVPPQATKLVEDELTFPQSIPLHLIDPITKAMSARRKSRHETIKAFLVELPQLNNEEETEIKEVEKPLLDTNFQTEDSQFEDSVESTDDFESTNSYKWLWIGGIVVVVIVAIAIITWRSKGVIEPGKKPLNLTLIDSMEWESPLGTAIYSGLVESDTIIGSDKLIPHVKGKAKIISGKYAGCVYDGEFSWGKMDGQAKYTQDNGDVFIGLFRNNQYDKGTYIIKSSGERYRGTFKNGKPDKGYWYDKKGNKLRY